MMTQKANEGRPCPRLFPNCIYVRCPLFACCCCDVDVGPLVKGFNAGLGPRSVLFSPPRLPLALMRKFAAALKMNHPKMIPIKWIAVLPADAMLFAPLWRSVSCETHENSYAKTLVVRFRF